MIDWLIENWVEIAVYSAIVGLALGAIATVILVVLRAQERKNFRKLMKKQ